MSPYRLSYLFLALLLVGCDPASNPANVGEGTCAPVDYHNGVLYFPCATAAFANSLSHYRETHPDAEVISIAGNGNGSYGHDQGYFVVIKKQYKAIRPLQ